MEREIIHIPLLTLLMLCQAHHSGRHVMQSLLGDQGELRIEAAGCRLPMH